MPRPKKQVTKCTKMRICKRIKKERKDKISEDHKLLGSVSSCWDSTDTLTPLSLAYKICNFEELPLGCPHLLVGASQVYSVLKGSYGIREAHQIFTSGYAVSIGRIAEAHFFNSNRANVTERQPSGRANHLPILVAKGDFLVDKINPVMIEVKCRSSEGEAKRLMRSKETILQIWMTLDVLQLKRAKLCVYHVQLPAGDAKSKSLPCLKLLGELDIVKESEFLQPELIPSFIDGYMILFESYLISQAIPYDTAELSRVRSLIAGTTTRTHSVASLPPHSPSEFCLNMFKATKPPAKVIAPYRKKHQSLDSLQDYFKEVRLKEARHASVFKKSLRESTRLVFHSQSKAKEDDYADVYYTLTKSDPERFNLILNDQTRQTITAALDGLNLTPQ